MRVAVIERDRPGGVCLNWGCIPSKALLNSAGAMDTIRGAAKEHGIETGEVRFDFKQSDRALARGRRQAVEGRALPFSKKNNVDFFEADASVTGPHIGGAARKRGQAGAGRSRTRGRADSDRGRVAASGCFPG